MAINSLSRINAAYLEILHQKQACQQILDGVVPLLTVLVPTPVKTYPGLTHYQSMRVEMLASAWAATPLAKTIHDEWRAVGEWMKPSDYAACETVLTAVNEAACAVFYEGGYRFSIGRAQIEPVFRLSLANAAALTTLGPDTDFWAHLSPVVAETLWEDMMLSALLDESDIRLDGTYYQACEAWTALEKDLGAVYVTQRKALNTFSENHGEALLNLRTVMFYAGLADGDARDLEG